MRKHLTIAALFIALLLPSLAKAQVTCDSGNPITVSNADTSTSTINYIPGYSFYNYSFSEVLILSDDLMGIGDIKALQFKPASTTAGDRFTNCEIYLANTELEDLSAGFLNDPTAFELVWSGNMSYTTTDWQTIVFDDAFAWDGTSNIVVAVRRNHGSYSNGSSFASFNAGATLGRYVYQDSGPYTIGSLPSGTGTSNVAWYKLIGCEGSGDVCYRVRDIQVSAITADGCTLSWTDTLNSGASYTIYDMSDTTVLGTSYTTSYTISGLNSNTVYNIAVVAECSSSSSSSYARVSFRTACGGYTAIPFTEGFEGLSTGQTPNCWQQLLTGSSNSGTFPSAYAWSNARTGNVYFEFESSTGQTEVAVLPAMENINTLKLTFWASLMNHNFVLEVGVMEDSVFVPVDTIDNLIVGSGGNWHGSYHEYTVYFSNYSGYGENMAMRVTSSGSYTLMLDDFDVSEDNGCYPLSNLHLEAADSAEITIAWSDEMNSGITYTVTYWKDGGDTTVVYSVSDTAYTASSLDANTNYHFIVTPDCSSGDGEPITASYRTTCGSIAIPFFDNFDSYPNGQFPPCWQRIRAHGTDPSVNNQYHHSGSQSMFLLALSDTTLFCTPSTVPLPGNMIKVTYQAYMGYSSYMNYVMWIKAGVMTNPYDLSTFISLDSVGYHNFNNVFEEREFNTSNLDADAEYYVAWMYYSNNNSYRGAVDDVSIVENNGCNKPHDAYIDSVGPYTAHLRWTNGGALASSYTLYYGTQNDITAATAITSVTDTFYTLTGLMPQTTYYAWVITECGGDNSDAKPFGSFTTQLTCAPLTNVTMGDISYTAAVVNWSYNTSVGFPSSEVVITLVDNTDTTIAPVVVSATGTSYTFTGLEAGHGYAVTLRNICDADGQFDTAANNTVSFMTTSCAELSQTSNNTSTYVPFNSYYNYSYTQSIYTPSEMPNIDTIHGIAFYTTASDSKTVEVYLGHTSLSTLSTSIYVSADSLVQMASNYTYSFTPGWNVINFDSIFVYDHTLGNLVVAVRNVSGSYTSNRNWATHATNGNQSVYWYQDASSIDMAAPSASNNGALNQVPAIRFVANCEVPTCFAPMVTVDATDSASISIHWTVEGIENSWQVGIKAAGDANYTYNPNPVADTFYTFTGLNAATTYTIIVSSLCIDTLSTTVTAATQCGIVAIPYFTDFEGLSSGQLPICWEQVQAGNSNSGTFPSAYNYSSNAYNGSIYFEFESSSGQTEVAALPAMNNISSLMLSFFASVMNTNFVLEAGVMEGNTFVPVDTVNLIAGSGGNWHGSYYEYEVYFSNYTGTGNRIALRVTGSGSYTLMMDDFTVSVNTGCPRPDQPVVTNVLADQISVSFSGSTSGDYMLYITDGASYVDSASVAGDSTFTFTGLSPVTTYTIDVHADCGTAISNPRSVSATTTMVPDTLPYSSGFEAGQDVSWLLVNGTQANQWVFGSAVNNGGTNALYISDNNGVGNSYNTSSTTNVYATKLFIFADPGDYSVSFDWIANGEGTWDYLRVFLVPGTVEPAAGNTSGIGTSGAPSGWIALDGGDKLNMVSSWQNHSEVFNITNAGNYKLVFFWHNDGIGGTNPPAAIDNVQINALSCPQPQNVAVTSVTDATATVQWTPVGSETEWEVSCNGTTTTVSTPTTVITGLEASHGYIVSVRAVCSIGDTSFASTANFVTDMCASAVTIENFDSTANQTSSYSPIGYSLYNYSYVQTIIPADRMSANGSEITAMAFQPSSTSAGTYFNNMDVYMANVSEDDLSAGFIHPSATTPFTHVIASASFNYSTTEWQIHALDTTFTWDGHSNVLIAVHRAHGQWTSGSSFRAHNDTAQRTRYVYQDAGGYNISDVSGGTASTTVGNIRLISCSGGCPAPVVSVSNIDYQSATITAHGVGSSYTLNYGTSPSNLSNNMTSTTGQFNLTSLMPATQYFFSVTQDCEDNEVSPAYESYFFTDSLPCMPVSGLTVAGTGYESVTLTWTRGGDENAWQVIVYNTVDTFTYEAATTTYEATGLTSGVTYNANVRPLCGSNHNIEGPLADEPVTFTTDICQPVTGVSVTGVSGTTATISWTAPAVAGSGSYRIEYGYTGFDRGQGQSATATGTTYTIEGLESQVTYDVYVANICTETLVSVWSEVTTFETTGGQGIADVDAEGNLSIYPNPASTTVTLSVSEQMAGSAVSIVDVNGRVVMSEELNGQTLTMNIRDLAKGAYFVRITGEQTTVVRKLIVE